MRMVENTQSVIPCLLCKNESPRIIFIKAGFNIVQCPSCGLIYVGNPPAEPELKKLYSFAFGYHTQFRVNNSHTEQNELNLAKKRLNFLRKYKTEGRLLDIGCSAGFFLKVARDNGWETYGLDISDDTARIARERYGLEVLTGTIEEISYAPNHFDVVMMGDVIEHTANPVNTMLAVNKILKPDGLVILSTPNIDGLFPKLSYKVSKIINYWPHPEPPGHLFQFSKETLTRLLTQTGFIPLEIADRRYSAPYTFGKLGSLIRSPKSLLYTAVFLPVLLLGPVVHAGDEMLVVAKKERRHR